VRIIDISQELFSCRVYPGDPVPQRMRITSMEQGEAYKLSSFSMCAHNGTHIDAPAHFLRDGKTVDQLSLDVFVGPCFVVWHQGDMTADAARTACRRAADAGAAERILIAGEATVTAAAARIFSGAGVRLIGNESQSVGPVDCPMEVHVILLTAGIVLLEGLVLTDVAEGRYFLCAAPLNLAGFEGSPCRAWLMAM